ncbi:oligosaccharide flippase family protein [Yimella radicis]
MTSKSQLSLAKNAFHTVGGTVLGSALLAALLLLMPKFLAKDDFGYYQLYLFYATYLGYLSFGIADGLFLRFSGSTLAKIPRRTVATHLWALAGVAGIVLGLGALLAYLFIDSPGTSAVIALACLSTWFYLLRCLLTFVYQAANDASLYARATVLERTAHVGLAIGVLAAGYRGFELFLWTDVVARLAGLAFTLYAGWEFASARPSASRATRSDLAESIRGGLFINLSALATVLVTAVARFAAERGFGIETFAEMSLAFSLQNIVLTVIAPLSLVILPSIRRQPADRIPSIYLAGISRVTPLLMAALAMYVPLLVVTHLWLPTYRQLPLFIGALMPMIVFESRTRVFAIPFLQAIRRERTLALVNACCLALSIGLSWIAVSVVDSAYALVLSLTVVIIVRALWLETLTQRRLGVSRGFIGLVELIIVGLFLAASSEDAAVWWWIVPTVAWLGYLAHERDRLRTLLGQVRAPSSRFGDG